MAHIFIWEYKKENLKQTFAPAFKYRISLNYEKFNLITDKLDSTRETKKDMREIYEKSLDLKHRVNSDGHYVFTMPGSKAVDRKLGQWYFKTLTFNSKLDYMSSKTGVYVKSPERAKLGRIRHSKDRKTIGIEILKEHVFGDKSFNTIEIVLFSATISKQAL
jgi:hypothetical protein